MDGERQRKNPMQMKCSTTATLRDAPPAPATEVKLDSKEKDLLLRAMNQTRQAKTFLDAADSLARTGKSLMFHEHIVTDASLQEALYTASNRLFDARTAVEDLRRSVNRKQHHLPIK